MTAYKLPQGYASMPDDFLPDNFRIVAEHPGIPGVAAVITPKVLGNLGAYVDGLRSSVWTALEEKRVEGLG